MRSVATWTMQVACGALVCAALAADAQTIPSERKSARSALSRELRDSLASILSAAVADRAFPGAYALVGDSRGVIAEIGAGHLDWAPSPRPDAHTLWDLASLTKVVGTTTALAQLVEAGRVELDAPVQRYLPA